MERAIRLAGIPRLATRIFLPRISRETSSKVGAVGDIGLSIKNCWTDDHEVRCLNRRKQALRTSTVGGAKDRHPLHGLQYRVNVARSIETDSGAGLLTCSQDLDEICFPRP